MQILNSIYNKSKSAADVNSQLKCLNLNYKFLKALVLNYVFQETCEAHLKYDKY